MATLKELKEQLGLTLITEKMEENKKVSDGCVCDLLSWVMARGQTEMAWITVQTHLNVVAVASLHDFSCIIIPENIAIPDMTIKKASEEEIAVFSSNKTAYQLCCEMCRLGIGL